MPKNPLGKTRDVANAYATFEANGFEYRIAKTYKLAKNEVGDPWARWNVWARSPFTNNQWEGPRDTSRTEVLGNMVLTYASPEFIEAYRDDPHISLDLRLSKEVDPLEWL
tara:strand:- start:50 stop:379 length:330 start_codon:yes stop_codon:yes gene_type:complete